MTKIRLNIIIRKLDKANALCSNDIEFGLCFYDAVFKLIDSNKISMDNTGAMCLKILRTLMELNETSMKIVSKNRPDYIKKFDIQDFELIEQIAEQMLKNYEK